MNNVLSFAARRSSRAVPCSLLVIALATWMLSPRPVAAQPAAGEAKAESGKSEGGSADKGASQKSADERAAAALNSPSAEEPAPKAAETADAKKKPTPSLLEFYDKGGPLMYALTVLSLLVIFFTVERILALRRSKIVPHELVKKLGELAASPGGLDPRKAYKLCQQFPSSAANVVRAMLLKAGRPNSEVEDAIKTATDREATRLYGNIRIIGVAYMVAPMFGLLGTTLGMIMLFYEFANAPPGPGMVNNLSAGIYTKLITTFAGLCVAIPAVVASQLLEAKIISMFNDIGELAESLVPQLERYEGKLRVTSKQLSEEHDVASSNGSPPAATHAKT